MLDKLIPWRRKQNQQSDMASYNDTALDPFGTGAFLPGLPFFRGNQMMPRVDIREGRKHITVKAEIPGVEKEDLDISINDGMLRIKGEKKQETEEKDENYYRIESGYGFFSRVIDLPAEVDPNDVDAKYKRGVLTVTMKKAKTAQSRYIPIKSG